MNAPDDSPSDRVSIFDSQPKTREAICRVRAAQLLLAGIDGEVFGVGEFTAVADVVDGLQQLESSWTDRLDHYEEE